MKNKLTDLRNHLFAQLERLGEENVNEFDVEQEVRKAHAIASIGKVLIEGAKAEMLYYKIKSECAGAINSEFMNDALAVDQKKIK